MWVFGYGSLIWKVDFPIKHKIPGHINGYMRRFWQASEDHRGIPGKPGRVATLVESGNAQEHVWGVAYEIGPEDKEQVAAHLDYREKDGYKKTSVIFYPADAGINPFPAIVYVGSENNPFFLGPATTEEIANQIYNAVGPSGTNTEYLFQLAEAIRKLAPCVEDTHLFQLEAAVEKLYHRKDP